MYVTPLVLTFCVGFSLAQDASNKKAAIELDGNDGAGPANARSKRLFFVSTTSSTSTLITAFTCYISAAALVTCKKRRKRSYLEESIDEQPQSLVEEAIDPARYHRHRLKKNLYNLSLSESSHSMIAMRALSSRQE